MELRDLLTGPRGRVAAEIRAGRATAQEIADALDLSTNNVRAHLASLLRDGVIESAGRRPGLRKPTNLYRLSAQAQALFNRAYEPVLVELATILAEQGGDLRSLFREVGARLAANLGPLSDLPLETRLDALANAFRALGAVPFIDREGDVLTIRGPRCPLAKVVEVTPDACAVALTLVQNTIGITVEEKCVRDPEPACHFVALLAS